MIPSDDAAITIRKSPYHFRKLRTAGVSLTHAVFAGLLALTFLRADVEKTSYVEAAPRKKPPTPVRPQKRIEPPVTSAKIEPPVSPSMKKAEPPPLTPAAQNPANQTASVFTPNAPTTNANIRNAGLLDRLVSAYPEFLQSHDGQSVAWRDGERMQFDDGRDKTSGERLELPDLEDSFFDAYPAGADGINPPPDFDPGRSIFEPFFTKMYGDCKTGDVENRMAEVVWLPENWGGKIKATTVNYVDERLNKISSELDDLPSEFMKYLKPPSDGYSCRPIAGTARIGMHSYAAAIDLNPAFGDNWQNARRSRRQYRYRNRIPLEIVDIFEKHGFIWGGRWSHFDTFHFEYRPELIAGFDPGPAAPRREPAQTVVRPAPPPETPQVQNQPQPTTAPAQTDSLPLPERQPRNIR